MEVDQAKEKSAEKNKADVDQEIDEMPPGQEKVEGDPNPNQKKSADANKEDDGLPETDAEAARDSGNNPADKDKQSEKSKLSLR